MVVGYTDTSSLWCDGIADSVGIRTSAYVWGSMHCSGGSRHSRRRLRPTVGSPVKKIELLASDFRDLADLDRSLPSREKRSFAVLIACRPWVFSMFEGLKRTAAA